MIENKEKAKSIGRRFRENLNGPGRERQIITFLLVIIFLGILTFVNSKVSSSATGILGAIQPLLSTAQSVVGTILGALVVFWLASIFLFDTKSSEIKDAIATALREASSRPSTLEEVDWAALIQEADEIDFVVQGWNGWMGHPNIQKELTQFFTRGGTFNLYVYDDENQESLYERQMLEERISRTPDAIREELVGTRRELLTAFDSATQNSNAKLNIYKIFKVNWYFALRYKTRTDGRSSNSRDGMIFSIYSHTAISPWIMPAALIAPAEFKHLVEWFEKELKHLREHAVHEIYPSSNIEGNS